MNDSAMRLVRCPNCRLQVESAEAEPVCPACGSSMGGTDAEQTFDDDTPERMPTQPNAIIRRDE